MFKACKDIESKFRSDLISTESPLEEIPPASPTKNREVYPPYLSPKDPTAPRLTLLLDLDETLMHYSDDNNINEHFEAPEEPIFFVRPGLNLFLTELSQSFELVLYTAASLDYANYFMKKIDRHKTIKHYLTREHCKIIPNQHHAIKDLRLVGRDLQTTIIVDNLKENF